MQLLLQESDEKREIQSILWSILLLSTEDKPAMMIVQTLGGLLPTVVSKIVLIKGAQKKMTFVYPAIFTPHKEDKGYHAYFPDLESCEVDAGDLEDAVEEARYAAYNWIMVELEDEEGELPHASHEEDIQLEAGQLLKRISVTVKLLPDND